MPMHLLISLEAMYLTFLVAGLVFFRKGKHSIKWFLTLLPFLAGATHLLQFALGAATPLIPLSGVLYSAASMLAALLVAGALLVYGCALGSHQIRIPMWHQKHDSPSQLVSWGIYSVVRHPFYTSYLLLMPASVLAAPTIPMLCIAAFCMLMLRHTAVVEERELLRVFGAEYAELMARTGRFFPRLRAAPRASARYV
jgi:protein-S-isoprenylcysteine O-methyltransferase Ste14